MPSHTSRTQVTAVYNPRPFTSHSQIAEIDCKFVPSTRAHPPDMSTIESKFRECGTKELLEGGIANGTGTWFESPGFGLLYVKPAATRGVTVDGNAPNCFAETRGFLSLKVLSFYGNWKGSAADLRAFLRAKGVGAATFSLLTKDQLTLFRDPALGARIAESNNDMVIGLPETPEQYLASLGSQTRKHLPYYQRRLGRDFQNRSSSEACWRDAVTESDFKALIELNRQRMSNAGRVHLWTDEMAATRFELIRRSGMLYAIKIDGKLAAGSASVVHGNEAFLFLIGHDPQYDKLSLGSLSLWLAINSLMLKGVRRYHLMWGNSFYKRQFGGDEEQLYKATVLLSPWAAACWTTGSAIDRATSLARRAWNKGWMLTKQKLAAKPARQAKESQPPGSDSKDAPESTP